VPSGVAREGNLGPSVAIDHRDLEPRWLGHLNVAQACDTVRAARLANRQAAARLLGNLRSCGKLGHTTGWRATAT
jgi:hypothetical protein